MTRTAATQLHTISKTSSNKSACKFNKQQIPNQNIVNLSITPNKCTTKPQILRNHCVCCRPLFNSLEKEYSKCRCVLPPVSWTRKFAGFQVYAMDGGKLVANCRILLALNYFYTRNDILKSKKMSPKTFFTSCKH